MAAFNLSIKSNYIADFYLKVISYFYQYREEFNTPGEKWRKK